MGREGPLSLSLRALPPSSSSSATMSHRRRILNLVTRNEFAGAYALRRVDLSSKHNSFFYPTSAAPAPAGVSDPKKMGRIRAPTRCALLFGRRIDWLAMSESKVVYFNHHQQPLGAFVYDADDARRHHSALPDFHVSNKFVPIAGDTEEDDEFYVMKRSPRPIGDVDDENGEPQFQAFVRQHYDDSEDDLWRCHELSMPPYVRAAGYRSTVIDSYAVVGGEISVSTQGIGTYCFDTASGAWSKAGDWAMPFSGKVEHVRELGVLVGFWASELGHRLCASGDDLSSGVDGGRRPMLRAWVDLETPHGDWHNVKAPQLVSLGSGKFCVGQFFKTVVKEPSYLEEKGQSFAVCSPALRWFSMAATASRRRRAANLKEGSGGQFAECLPANKLACIHVVAVPSSPSSRRLCVPSPAAVSIDCSGESTSSPAKTTSSSQRQRLRRMPRLPRTHPSDDGLTAEESLANVQRMQLDCAALSDSKTVYVDSQSGGAFIYDADARCVHPPLIAAAPHHRARTRLCDSTMSHRRRFLNLVMRNDLTGIYSLRRVNLLSRKNNLFYPTAKAAEDAAGAKDPAILFPPNDDDGKDYPYDGPTGEESLEKVQSLHVPPPSPSFQPISKRCGGSSWPDCAALSETKTVFVDSHSGDAFLHDAEARSVVAMPALFPPNREHWRWGRLLFPISGDGDTVYALDMEPGKAVKDEDKFKFHAMAVHRDGERSWQLEELPRPPYADVVHPAAAYRKAQQIVSHGMAGGGEVIWVSTESRGTYCFDTARCIWSKAVDWGLPFDGKVEHDRDLGICIGFLKSPSRCLCASIDDDLFTDVDDSKWLPDVDSDDCFDMEPPWGWDRICPEPQVVSLGSGKFCVTQFFETMGSERSGCGYDQTFAVFTGVEVVRRGRDDDENVEQEGNGSGGSTNITPPTELRLIVHKSKRYMLTQGLQGNTIEFERVHRRSLAAPIQPPLSKPAELYPSGRQLTTSLGVPLTTSLVAASLPGRRRPSPPRWQRSSTLPPAVPLPTSRSAGTSTPLFLLFVSPPPPDCAMAHTAEVVVAGGDIGARCAHIWPAISTPPISHSPPSCVRDDDWRQLVPPWGWHEDNVVGLGSGKFCVTQFFEMLTEACSVVRRGSSSVNDVQACNVNGKITAGTTEDLRLSAIAGLLVANIPATANHLNASEHGEALALAAGFSHRVEELGDAELAGAEGDDLWLGHMFVVPSPRRRRISPAVAMVHVQPSFDVLSHEAKLDPELPNGSAQSPALLHTRLAVSKQYVPRPLVDTQITSEETMLLAPLPLLPSSSTYGGPLSVAVDHGVELESLAMVSLDVPIHGVHGVVVSLVTGDGEGSDAPPWTTIRLGVDRGSLPW
ncbi:hypothetical protein HU200_067623 [Digitaria exilis]|uniref:Uncharacterized protein n=1 Tax=Digitaria exilis TaxID=1010633 RepID=A0A835DVS4_9POAL|nr:hypothetical protein HU200_067623 [Digitaria exilis]